jgi:hypothetical protein
MAVILTDALDKRHCANVVSKSGLVTLVMIGVSLVLPLFLVVNTHNYWVDTASYFEQPSIQHNNEIVVFVQTDTDVYSFASTKSLNSLIDASTEAANSIAPEFNVSIVVKSLFL